VTGTVVSSLRYYPYGGTRSGSMATDRRYTGQRWEASVGFYDYGARSYDPALGRFLQADTIVPNPANPQSLNRYAYVLNNPLKYTDPTGHFPEEEIEKYLENLGYDEAAVDQIITKWKQDSDWWAIIGSDENGAQIGDWIQGLVLDKDGLPQDRYTFYFRRDGDTFKADLGDSYFSPLSISTAFRVKDYTISSLVDLQNYAVDIFWARGTKYMGGTGHASDGGKAPTWEPLWDATFYNTIAWGTLFGGLATKTFVGGSVGVFTAKTCWEDDVTPNVLDFYRALNTDLYMEWLTIDEGIHVRN
jgi:RHS repeat-associated protein